MNQKDRQNVIVTTSALNIIANLLLATIKIVIGVLASSLAIISEGINNATDCANSLLALVGAKLSAKHPDKDHPFGYGRVEYLTNLVVAIMILYSGLTLLKESVLGIIHPSNMEVSILMTVIIIISALFKFFLGLYTKRMGKKAESTALDVIGADCQTDSYFSILTIAVIVIYMKFHINLDAYAGILFACILIKAGYDALMETINDLLGRPGKEDLAKEIYREIRSTKGIVNAADLMIHNYGPDAYSGSVNIEIDHKTTVGEVYKYIHELQLRIMHEYHVTLVFGIYAIDNDHEELKEVRKHLVSFVREHEHVTSYHALYIDDNNKMYCDLIVDYELADWDALKEEFNKKFNELYPGREIELTIETEYI